MDIRIFPNARDAIDLLESDSLLARCFLPEGGVLDLRRLRGEREGFLTSSNGVAITPGTLIKLEPFIEAYKKLELAGQRRAIDLDILGGVVRSQPLQQLCQAELDALRIYGYSEARGAFRKEAI